MLDKMASMLEAMAEPKEKLKSLTFLEWVTRHRIIQDRRSGRLGPFRLDDYLWLEDIYKAIGELAPGRRAMIRKAAQMGLTELAINFTFWHIDLRGVRVFYALPPGQGITSDFAHDRIDKAIAHSRRIQELAAETDNVGLKTFVRGALYIRGTHIPQGRPEKAAQLSQVPADVAVIDEWDRVPPAAIPLIRDRLGDSRLGLELGLSTPTYPGAGIDAEYQESDRREPQIRCQKCGKWHWLEWGLVAERDGQVACWCPTCGAAMDRRSAWDQKRMRFIARNPKSGVVGYWIPKLVSPRASLADLWKRSKKKAADEILAFWNNDLGLPYEPKGARLTLELLRACARDFTMPDTASWCAMGVDVGLTLNVWIIEPWPGGKRRSVYIGEVGAWEDLDRLMVRYGVGCCVVDDLPELTADVAFARRHRGRVFLATYVDEIAGAEWCQFDLKKQKVRIDRTAGLDRAHGNVEVQVDELPRDFEAIPGFVEQMTVNLKAKAVKADGTVYYHFPHTGRPDHYDHAKVYAEAAMERLTKLRPPGEREEGGDELPASGKGRYRGRA